MASALVCLALSLCLHACTARPLIVRDKGTVMQTRVSNEGIKTSVTGTYVTLGNLMAGQGKEVKSSHPGKILHQAAGAEIWKRADRSTLESPTFDAEENVNAKDNNTVEDIVVMDYAQPHRKPPIHNRGT